MKNVACEAVTASEMNIKDHKCHPSRLYTQLTCEPKASVFPQPQLLFTVHPLLPIKVKKKYIH
jgi:hypothetical protein